MASYVLATNANIPRIQGMIERVCRTFGTEMDGYHAFPTPGQLLDRCERAEGCGLGYRSKRFIELARLAYREEIDFPGLMSMDYEDCVRELAELPGIGPKVADCEGTYGKVNRLSRERFGRWAGYAQEYIYYAYGR
jgi:N-glycosylase/DNA lyase